MPSFKQTVLNAVEEALMSGQLEEDFKDYMKDNYISFEADIYNLVDAWLDNDTFYGEIRACVQEALEQYADRAITVEVEFLD